MSTELDVATQECRADTFLVGDRIDVRALGLTGHLATDPLTVRLGEGVAVIFRYGVVTFFDVPDPDIVPFLRSLKDHIRQPFEEPETETIAIRFDSDAREAVAGNTLFLKERSVERFQVVADVLSKSVALAGHENRIVQSFQLLEPVALDLQHRGTSGRRARGLLRHIGGSLVSELRMIGRVEVADKPELTWDNPELERLYARLAEEFELRERYAVLDRKLRLISRTAHTVLDLLQHRHSIRVEWYIVILIVVEILLTIYDLFLRAG